MDEPKRYFCDGRLILVILIPLDAFYEFSISIFLKKFYLLNNYFHIFDLLALKFFW